MQVRYRMSKEDYLEAQKLMRKLASPFFRYMNWVLRAILVASVFLLLFTALNGKSQFESVFLNLRPLLVILVFYFLLFPILLPFLASRAYRKNIFLQREITAKISEEGYEADDGAGANNSATWDHYDRFLEGKRVFIFGNPSRIFTIVSKAAMTQEEQQYFRTVLHERIGKPQK
jgi:hypothetical protein